MRTALRFLLLAEVLCSLLLSACRKESAKDREREIQESKRVIGPLDTVLAALPEPFTLSPWDYSDLAGKWKRITFNLPHKVVVTSIKIFIAPDASGIWLEVPHVSTQNLVHHYLFNGKLYIDIYETQFSLMDFNKEINVKINYKRLQ